MTDERGRPQGPDELGEDRPGTHLTSLGTETWLDAAQYHLGPFAFGAVLMSGVNLAILAVLGSRYPDVAAGYLEYCVSPLFAGVQEPFTSKFVPAVFILWWAERDQRAHRLRTHSWRVALGGGLTVGLLEFGGKVINAGALQAAMIPPIALHALTGLLVGTAVFRSAGRRRGIVAYHVFLLGLLLAILAHVAWNSQVGFWLAGANPC